MAIVAMANAVPGAIASSAEYNKVVANVVDLDSRIDKQNIATITTTSNSSTWNSATEVLTNLVASGGNAVTLVSGRRYRVTCNFTVVSGSVASTVSYRLRITSGTSNPTSSNFLIIASPDRLHTGGGAVSRVHLIGEFVAGASGAHSIGLFGCNPSGDTAAAGLYASSSTSGNGLCTNIMVIDTVR